MGSAQWQFGDLSQGMMNGIEVVTGSFVKNIAMIRQNGVFHPYCVNEVRYQILTVKPVPDPINVRLIRACRPISHQIFHVMVDGYFVPDRIIVLQALAGASRVLKSSFLWFRLHN